MKQYYSDEDTDFDLVEDFYQDVESHIVKRNAEFEEASEAERRVIIARDVLRMIASDVLTPTMGTYGPIGYVNFDNGAYSKPLRDNMLASRTVCRGCARAGLVFAAILRRGGVMGNKFRGDAAIEEFPFRMFADIELAFESPEALASPLHWDPWQQAARENWWYCYYSCAERDGICAGQGDSAYRILRIMRWIIDHKGEFDLMQFLQQEASRLLTGEADIQGELAQLCCAYASPPARY